jgi:hypothetical protein
LKITVVTLLAYAWTTRNSKHPLLTFSHVQICRVICRVIIGVYFSIG